MSSQCEPLTAKLERLMLSDPVSLPPVTRVAVRDGIAAGSDVNALRAQVDRLQHLVDVFGSRLEASGPIVGSAANEIRPSAVITEFSGIERSATDLEHLIMGGATTSGALPVRTDYGGQAEEEAHVLMRLFGVTATDKALVEVLPQLLPNTAAGLDLSRAFFQGPIHKAWSVGFPSYVWLTLRSWCTYPSLRRLNRCKEWIWRAWKRTWIPSGLPCISWYVSCHSIQPAADLQTLAFATRCPPGSLAATDRQAKKRADLLAKTSEQVLHMSDYVIRPQIAHVQLCILYVVYHLVRGYTSQVEGGAQHSIWAHLGKTRTARSATSMPP